MHLAISARIWLYLHAFSYICCIQLYLRVFSYICAYLAISARI